MSHVSVLGVPSMTRSARSSRALFDTWAATYRHDVYSAEGPLAGYAESLEAAAALLPLPQDATLLDVGIGAGAFAELFAERRPRVHGIDASAEMLAECRQAHPDYALEHGLFVSLPYTSASFHAVVSSFAFHEVAPSWRARACREMARVLCPGGHVCLLDIMFASPEAREAARQELGNQWDEDEDYPLIGRLDAHLRAAGLGTLHWLQTGPYHWAVMGRKDA